jgi:hypothetical protein
MVKTNRNHPITASSSEATTTLLDFERRYPDDASCLEELVGMLYPAGIFCATCEKVTKHHRVSTRTCYACQFCGHQEYPMKGTIFEGSSTSLRHWFYAMYLMASTRCGISAKQLEREIGVSYPTAHRMFKKIRSLLAQDDAEKWDGTVEFDDAYIGGQARWRSPARSRAAGVMQGGHGGETPKTPVAGAAQRGRKGRHGKVQAKVKETSTSAGEFQNMVVTKVLPGSSATPTTRWPTAETWKGSDTRRGASSTRRRCTCRVTCTRTRLKDSGRCSKVGSEASITPSLPTTRRTTWTNTPSATTTAMTRRGCSTPFLVGSRRLLRLILPRSLS